MTYRLLDAGEVVQDGDEWFDPVEFEWAPCDVCLGTTIRHVGTVRRSCDREMKFYAISQALALDDPKAIAAFSQAAKLTPESVSTGEEFEAVIGKLIKVYYG